MLRRVVRVRTDVSEELRASFIRVTRIGELGTTLAVTSNRRTLRRNTKYLCERPKSFFTAQGRRSHGAEPTGFSIAKRILVEAVGKHAPVQQLVRQTALSTLRLS
jgi:hypothetical protein